MQLRLANYGGCIFAVSHVEIQVSEVFALLCCAVSNFSLILLALLLMLRMQVVSFAVTALYSGMWFLRFVAKERMGLQLGWFSGIVCVGSIGGAVAWGSFMQSNALYYEATAPNVTRQQHYTLLAASNQWYVRGVISYSAEFVCFIISKLLLLGRLANNAAQSSQAEVTEMSGVRKRWLTTVSGRALPRTYRVMAIAVVVGSVVDMLANFVSGAFEAQTAIFNIKAAAACNASGEDTIQSLGFFNSSILSDSAADTAQSVQFIGEAFTLLLITISYVCVVSWSLVLFRMVERTGLRALKASVCHATSHQVESRFEGIVADTVQAAVEHRRRLTAACLIVLIFFPARAVYDLLFAYSSFDAPLNPACGICDPCQSDQYLIAQVLLYSPEFQPIVIVLSSPLSLSLSLFLITKAHERAQLIAADVQRGGLGVA